MRWLIYNYMVGQLLRDVLVVNEAAKLQYAREAKKGIHMLESFSMLEDIFLAPTQSTTFFLILLSRCGSKYPRPLSSKVYSKSWRLLPKGK